MIEDGAGGGKWGCRYGDREFGIGTSFWPLILDSASGGPADREHSDLMNHTTRIIDFTTRPVLLFSSFCSQLSHRLPRSTFFPPFSHATACISKPRPPSQTPPPPSPAPPSPSLSHPPRSSCLLTSAISPINSSSQLTILALANALGQSHRGDGAPVAARPLAVAGFRGVWMDAGAIHPVRRSGRVARVGLGRGVGAGGGGGAAVEAAEHVGLALRGARELGRKVMCRMRGRAETSAGALD